MWLRLWGRLCLGGGGLWRRLRSRLRGGCGFGVLGCVVVLAAEGAEGGLVFEFHGGQDLSSKRFLKRLRNPERFRFHWSGCCSGASSAGGGGTAGEWPAGRLGGVAVLTGACPGVAFAQLGEGQLMALITIVGIFIGNAIYAAAHRKFFRWDTGSCEAG